MLRIKYLYQAPKFTSSGGGSDDAGGTGGTDSTGGESGKDGKGGKGGKGKGGNKSRLQGLLEALGEFRDRFTIDPKLSEQINALSQGEYDALLKFVRENAATISGTAKTIGGVGKLIGGAIVGGTAKTIVGGGKIVFSLSMLATYPVSKPLRMAFSRVSEEIDNRRQARKQAKASPQSTAPAAAAAGTAAAASRPAAASGRPAAAAGTPAAAAGTPAATAGTPAAAAGTPAAAAGTPAAAAGTPAAAAGTPAATAGKPPGVPPVAGAPAPAIVAGAPTTVAGAPKVAGAPTVAGVPPVAGAPAPAPVAGAPPPPGPPPPGAPPLPNKPLPPLPADVVAQQQAAATVAQQQAANADTAVQDQGGLSQQNALNTEERLAGANTVAEHEHQTSPVTTSGGSTQEAQDDKNFLAPAIEDPAPTEDEVSDPIMEPMAENEDEQGMLMIGSESIFAEQSEESNDDNINEKEYNDENKGSPRPPWQTPGHPV